MRDFSIHNVRFRLIAKDTCAIVVFGHDVGELRKHGDAFDPDSGPWFTAMLFDSEAPPIRIDHRAQIRLAVADALWAERLVPVEPPIHVPAGPAAARAA